MFVGAAGGGAGPTVGSHNSFFSVFIYLPKDVSLLLYRFDGADYLSRQYVPPPLPPLVRRSYVAVVVVSSLYDDLLWYRLARCVEVSPSNRLSYRKRRADSPLFFFCLKRTVFFFNTL